MMIRSLIALFLVFFIFTTDAQAEPHQGDGTPIPFKAELITNLPLKIGQENTVTLQLTQDKNPVTLNDLKEVHTRKIHLLVVDSTLTDYHHVHPVPAATAGNFTFTFTPQKQDYRVWVDITPLKTGKQNFVMADLGSPDLLAHPPIKTLSKESRVGDYTFRFTLQQPLVVGQASMATVDITDAAGKPVTTLQPVMGAFGHIVGFSQDFHTIAHIHPMGEEPKTDSDRGGPTLTLHLEPQKSGFLKLFVQTHIGDQDIFAPFGVMVNEAPKP